MNNITTPSTYEVLQRPGSNTDTKLLVTHVYNLTESTTLTDHVNGTYGNYTTETAVKISYNWPVLCLFSIVVCALIGNILVCLAVRYEHKLQNMFNYFLVSLALSDMLSASIVMPLSIIKTFIEPLPVPKLLCVTWYSLDVLFTSSTIIHLCMISIDRYMSFKYPLKWGHAKKTKHTVFKIIIVWIISICIAGPLFVFSMFDTQTMLDYKGCGPETTTFVISATVTSFYLPLLIMTIMYILTVRALHHQRRNQRRLAVIGSTSTTADREESTFNNSITKSPKIIMRALTTAITSPRSTVVPPGGSPLLRRESYENTSTFQTTYTDTYQNARNSLCAGDNCRPSSYSGYHPPSSRNSLHTNDCSLNYSDCSTNSRGLSPSGSSTAELTLNDLPSPTSPSSSDQQVSTGRVSTLRVRRSPHSSRRNSPDKGRRAVQVLGIMFAVFVIFYLPFFATYVINGTCVPCQQYISPKMVTTFEWLAYSGSMVNPIIYHIFNPDFRRAFHKILRCKCTSV